jgi:hypothetical protein
VTHFIFDILVLTISPLMAQNGGGVGGGVLARLLLYGRQTNAIKGFNSARDKSQHKEEC